MCFLDWKISYSVPSSALDNFLFVSVFYFPLDRNVCQWCQRGWWFIEVRVNRFLSTVFWFILFFLIKRAFRAGLSFIHFSWFWKYLYYCCYYCYYCFFFFLVFHIFFYFLRERVSWVLNMYFNQLMHRFLFFSIMYAVMNTVFWDILFLTAAQFSCII